MINILLPRIGDKVLAKKAHRRFVELMRQKSGFTEYVDARVAGSVGGARRQGRLAYQLIGRDLFLVRVA